MTSLKQIVCGLLCACLACVDGTEIASGDAGTDAPAFDGEAPDVPGTDTSVPRTGWPVTFGGELPDLATDLAVDDAGNLYVAGTYSSPAMFGDTVLSGGSGGSFVASYTSAGELRWVESVGTRSSIVQDRVHVAVSGDQVIVAANFNNTVSRDGETLEPVDADFLLAAFSTTDGSFQWWTHEGGANDQRILDLLVDGSGDIYVSGEYTETATIGGTALNGERFAGVIAAYNSAGEFRWVRSPSNGQSGPLAALTMNGADLIVSGEFLSAAPSLMIEGTPLGGEFGDTYLLALSTDNEVRWARESAQGGVEVRQMVSVGGSTFAVASFRGAAVVGGETYITTGTYDVLVMAFDASGNAMWARSYGSDDLAPIDHGTGIATDGTNVFVTGQVAGVIDFGGGELDPTPFMGNYNAFVLELSTSGDYAWSTAFATSAQDGSTESIAVHAGEVYLAAPFTRTLDIGGTMVEALGWEDGVVTRVDR